MQDLALVLTFAFVPPLVAAIIVRIRTRRRPRRASLGDTFDEMWADRFGSL